MEFTIPEGSVEIQTGLWAHLITLSFNGEEILKYDIYSADGYCFWNVQQPENYDEDGNLKPPAERIYARVAYTCFSTIEELNANFISAPIEEGYEIVSVGDETEIM